MDSKLEIVFRQNILMELSEHDFFHRGINLIFDIVGMSEALNLMQSKLANLCKILNGIEIKNKGHQNNSVFVSITGNEQLFTLLLCEV